MTDCNVRATYPIFGRKLPTWTAMGMPLVIDTSLDVDLKIVEDENLDTTGCFTYCDADNNPAGYTNGQRVGSGTFDQAGPTRSADLKACSEPNAFKIDACTLDVAVNLVTGAGDEAAEATIAGTPVVVGLWDPNGVSSLDGLKLGAGAGRRRRLDEDQDGEYREERFVKFASGESSDEHIKEQEILNPFTQSPRGSLVLSVDTGGSVRDYLETLPDLPTDPVSSGVLRIAPVFSMGAILITLINRRDSSLLVLLALVAIPLVASQALCGCPDKIEVVLTVPKGFSFSRFEFSGEGKVACSSCAGDTSRPTDPADADDTEETVDPSFESALVPTFFDPRVFMGRPLKIESETPMSIVFRNHGIEEVSSVTGMDDFATQDLEVTIDAGGGDKDTRNRRGIEPLLSGEPLR